MGTIKNMIGILGNKKNNSLTKQVIQNASYSLTISIISKVGGLIFAIILARILLPELFGLYSLASSIVITIGTFADLGVSNALIKYLSESAIKGKKGHIEARSRVKFFFSVKIFITFLTALVLFLGSTLIANVIFKKPELQLPLRIGSFYILAIGIQTFLASVFIALKKLKYNLISEIILQVLRIGLFISIIQVYRNVSTVFIALIGAFLISALFYSIALLINYKFLIAGKKIKLDKKKIVSFMGWTTISSIFMAIFVSINTFVLGLFVKTEFIAYFNAIFSIVLPITTIINLTAVFLPIFTSVTGKRLARGFKKVVKSILMFSIPITIGLSFIIVQIIRIIYGADYFPGIYFKPLLISAILLCFLIPVEILNSVYVTLFTSKGHVKKIAYLLVFITILSTILNYILAKIALPYGMIWAVVGVSVGTFISRYLWFVILNLELKKKFNLGIIKKDLLKPFLSSLLMIGCLLLFILFLPYNLLFAIIALICSIAIYFLSLILTKFIK